MNAVTKRHGSTKLFFLPFFFRFSDECTEEFHPFSFSFRQNGSKRAQIRSRRMQQKAARSNVENKMAIMAFDHIPEYAALELSCCSCIKSEVRPASLRRKKDQPEERQPSQKVSLVNCNHRAQQRILSQYNISP